MSNVFYKILGYGFYAWAAYSAFRFMFTQTNYVGWQWVLSIALQLFLGTFFLSKPIHNGVRARDTDNTSMDWGDEAESSSKTIVGDSIKSDQPKNLNHNDKSQFSFLVFFKENYNYIILLGIVMVVILDGFRLLPNL